MMRLITRVFYKELLAAIFGVMAGFLLLFATIDAFGLVNKVGDFDFTYRTMFQVVALKIPDYAYQLLPICTLIGSVLALSSIASRSELVVWRVSGLSLMRLMRLMLGLGFLLTCILWLVGEMGLARAERLGKEVSDKALHKKEFFEGGGYWSKQNLADGKIRMINVKSLESGSTLKLINLYEFSPDFVLQTMVQAKSGTQQAKVGTWQLHDVRVVKVKSDASGAVTRSTQTELPELTVDLAENTLTVFRNYDQSRVNLTLHQLQERINALSDTGQSARKFEVAYWQKVIYPLGILVMMLLSLPFAYMQTRKGGVGIRVFAGILIGLLFFVLTAMAQYLGSLVSWSPIVLAAAPSALFLVIALVWIYRVVKV